MIGSVEQKENDMSTIDYGTNEWLAIRERVEQGRRNMEALARLVSYFAGGAPSPFEAKEVKEIKEAISSNIKVMNQVTEL